MSWKKNLIETGLIRYQLLLFLISSMCEKLAFFQEYGYLLIKMNTTFINRWRMVSSHAGVGSPICAPRNVGVHFSTPSPVA